MRKVDSLCPCPLEGVIDTVSKKWSLLIINALGNHSNLRFNNLMDLLQGIGPKTLSDTLKVLMKTDLVKRQAFAEIPPRVEYSLTEEGHKLRKAVVPLLRWAAARTPKSMCPILLDTDK